MNNKKSDFLRRLSFYGFGLAMGMILVSVITKGKACQLPSTVKLEELRMQPLEYTQHARCRMDCRKITEEEIKDVLKTGTINYSKSEVHAEPCPKYAVEGSTTDGQHVRIIIGDCGEISKVITTIDLGMENDGCDCK